MANTGILRLDLPLKGSLTPAYVASSAIVLLMMGASLAGLLRSAAVYPARDLLRAFLPNDVVNLIVGMPMLLASMWLARRGALLGLLLWPGALLYALYNYLVPLFAVPLNMGVLLYLVLVALSLYTLVGLVACIDAGAVRDRLAGAVPEKAGGAILAGFGVLFLLRAAAVMAAAALRHSSPGAPELAVSYADVLLTPAWIIGGVSLWRRNAFGYLSGLALLFQASTLFLGLIAYMILLPYTVGERFVPRDAAVVCAMGLIFFIPFGMFSRGVAGKRVLRLPRSQS
jgi:hypothetical protein